MGGYVVCMRGGTSVCREGGGVVMCVGGMCVCVFEGACGGILKCFAHKYTLFFLCGRKLQKKKIIFFFSTWCSSLNFFFCFRSYEKFGLFFVEYCFNFRML